MRKHPLWNAYDPPSMQAINAVRAELGVWKPSLVEVDAPDSSWPRWYGVVRGRIVSALGDRVLAIEHVGSTAVPGLWAKPMIDVDLTIADSTDEDAWLADLESAGFELRSRIPAWEHHRILRGENPAANLHVSTTCTRRSSLLTVGTSTTPTRGRERHSAGVDRLNAPSPP